MAKILLLEIKEQKKKKNSAKFCCLIFGWSGKIMLSRDSIFNGISCKFDETKVSVKIKTLKCLCFRAIIGKIEAMEYVYYIKLQ